MKKLIIFDLDGTLLYTVGDILDALNKVLSDNGFNTLTEKEVLKNLGYGAKELVRRSSNCADEKLFEKIFSEYVTLQENCQNEKTKLYDGLDEVLINLKKLGYKLAIVSNKPDSITQVVYEQLLKKYDFDFVTGNQPHLFNPKPDKTCVEYCLKVLNMAKEDAVYVGDSEVDVQTFISSSVDGIGVTWGFRPKELLVENGCTMFADNPKELFDVIIKL